MKESSNHKMLIEEVVNHSISSIWLEAKLEWLCIGEDLDTPGYCICGHKLNNLYYIKNKHNGEGLTVGSTCVKKFYNENMTCYVNAVEKRVRDEKKAEKKRLEELNKPKSINTYIEPITCSNDAKNGSMFSNLFTLKLSYEDLKLQQTAYNIPVSFREGFLKEIHRKNIINDFELKFYNDIYYEYTLSPKQLKFKEGINKKGLDYFKNRSK